MTYLPLFSTVGCMAAALVVWLLVMSISGAAEEEEEEGDWLDLRISEAQQQQWCFIGGPWQGDEAGLVIPHQGEDDENLAFFTEKVFSDFEAEFEFRWENVICGAGFVFRAQDARHYYMVHFPCTGQQYRAEYFWAAISKVDESGWVKVLKMELVSGTPSEIGTWHKVRLVVEANEIRLWVNGRPFPVVVDDTHPGPGCVGLESYSGTGGGPRSCFRGLRIRGKVEPVPGWDETIQPVQNWFYPTLENTYGNVHHLSSITRAPNGELLMKLACGDEFHGGQDNTPVLIRSSDNGRTWSAMQKLPDRLLHGALHTTHDDRLLQMSVPDEWPHPILIAESQDNGRTWSEYQQCGTLGFPEDVDLAYVISLLETRNGDLVLFILNHSTKALTSGGPHQWGDKEPDHPWGDYCIRSTDGGRTWSAPVNLNGPKPEGFEDRGMIKKHFGSEVSAAETREGKIVAFVRPFYEPVMWETWSVDGGQTWTPAHRGPFGMWACHNSMLRTASGALVIAGRHPGLAFNLSYDDGMTWRCYRFDTTFWANGFVCEIEPNVVMYASTAKYSDPHVRVHLFRITSEGPEPVRYGETEQ